jgi:methyl-accepting chemotaxis protein
MRFFKSYTLNLNIGQQLLTLISCFFLVIAYLFYTAHTQRQRTINTPLTTAQSAKNYYALQHVYENILNIALQKTPLLETESLSRLNKTQPILSEQGNTAYTALKEEINTIAQNSKEENNATLAMSALTKINIVVDQIAESLHPNFDKDTYVYHLRSAIFYYLPKLVKSSFVFQTNPELKAFLRSSGLSANATEHLYALKGALKPLTQELEKHYLFIFKNAQDNSALKALEPSYRSAKKLTESLLSDIAQALKEENLSPKNLQSIMNKETSLQQEYFVLWKGTTEAFISALEAESSALNSEIYQSLIITFILVFGCFVFSYYIYKSINVPINHFVQTINSLQKNQNYEARIENIPSGELGLLAQSFNNILEQISHSRHQEKEKQALEQKALEDISKLVDAISGGNIKQRIAVQEKEGFVQEVAKGLNKLIDNIEQFLNDISSAMDCLTKYDLTININSEYQGDFNTLKTDVNNAIQSIASIIKLLTQTTNQVAVTSTETSLAISQISDGAQTQILSIDNVVKQVAMTTKSNEDITINADSASNMARESVKLALEGREQMVKMVKIVNNIAENSAKINTITETIEKIANKTNLLSLNAAIEAARAGEHGKGFAVVADEVGKLASSAADSTQEISMLIHEATSEAYKAVESVGLISQDMEKIQSFIEANDEMLNKISASIEAQNTSLINIQDNMKDLQRVANNNAAAAEEITSTAIDLAKISDVARKELNKIKV